MSLEGETPLAHCYAPRGIRVSQTNLSSDDSCGFLENTGSPSESSSLGGGMSLVVKPLRLTLILVLPW